MQNNTVLSWLILAFTQKQFYTPVAALGKIKKKMYLSLHCLQHYQFLKVRLLLQMFRTLEFVKVA
jgi:hypothetical protein